MIKAKDYFDPAIYERMAQIRANAALQQGNIRANQTQQNTQMFSKLLPVLAKMFTDYQQKKEAQDYFAPKDYTVGDVRPIGGETVVRGDLLSSNPNIRQTMTPTLIPQYQEQGTFNPATDPSRLMQGQMSDNPYIAEKSKIGISNLLMQQPKYAELSAGSYGKQTNPFSNAPDIQVPKQYNPTQKNSVTIPTGKTKQEGGYWKEEVIDSDPVTHQPLPGAIPRWEPKSAVSQTGMTGSDFNAWRKSPDYQEVLKATANGSSKFSSLTSGRFSTMAQKQQFLADVRKVNPDFKEYTYDNDKVFKQLYLPGKQIGNKIANLNTAVEHTGKLMNLVDQLGNNDAQFINGVKNWFANTFGTQRAEPLNSFEAVKSALSGELGSLFKGGNAAATDPEIDNISKVISSAQNPLALKDALKMYLTVGKDRIDQFSEPYNNRFGDNQDFLNSNPRKILQNYGIIEGQNQQSNAPAIGTVEGGYKFKGGDPADPNNWEQQ